MAILVTGGAGFIGGHMVLELLDAGEKVVVIDDLSTGFDWAVPNGVPLIIGDCGNTDLLAETIIKYEIDEIIHFAAKIIVPESVKYPMEYYLNNTANSRSLIDASQRGGVKKLYFHRRRRYMVTQRLALFPKARIQNHCHHTGDQN